MVKKTLAVAISVALIASIAIPALNYFSESNGNDNIVFEYNNKKVYETEVTPYVEYYSKINQNFDTDAKNQAVDNYIRSVLLSQFSKDLGTVVTDEDVFKYIHDSPIFKDGDKFSKEKYDQFIRNLNVKANIFESEVRKDLLIVKLMEKMDKLSNIENYYFDIINETLAQKRVIEKVRVNMNSLPVVYDELLMKQKYEENKDKYRQPSQIIFKKYTYINPLNQSEKPEDKELMDLETKKFYDSVSKLPSKELSAKLMTENLPNSSMSLNETDFSKIVGIKINDKINKGTFLIDSEGLENGVVSIYEITNMTKGRQMDFTESYAYLERDYEKDMKLKEAKEYIKAYDNYKDAVGVYFDKYTEEVVDPLKNDQADDFYNLIYAMPIGGYTLYYDNDVKSYYFIKVKNVEKIELTKEQTDYFRLSQNNMYKQFVLLSVYDSVKKHYNLKRYKKES